MTCKADINGYRSLIASSVCGEDGQEYGGLIL